MSSLPRPRRLTVAEYLAIENAAAFRSEFYDGEMFAMAGAAEPHTDIRENLADEIGSRLRGSPCRKASSDQRVRVEPNGLYTYPDLVITCGQREYDPLDQKKTTLTNPTVLIEVLSPSTEAYDRGPKLGMYQRLDSVRAVVLVCQDRVSAEVYSRQPDGRWLHEVFDDPAGELTVPGLPVEVRIPLADVYRGVDLPERPPLRADHPPHERLGHPPPAG
jgi:Uma2 family endonuclease